MVLMSLMNVFHMSNLGSPQSGWVKGSDPYYFGLYPVDLSRSQGTLVAAFFTMSFFLHAMAVYRRQLQACSCQLVLPDSVEVSRSTILVAERKISLRNIEARPSRLSWAEDGSTAVSIRSSGPTRPCPGWVRSLPRRRIYADPGPALMRSLEGKRTAKAALNRIFSYIQIFSGRQCLGHLFPIFCAVGRTHMPRPMTQSVADVHRRGIR
jgi:hypothetical protein